MDNKRALKKILDELNQEKPRLDYIKGMLEVLIGDEDVKITSTHVETSKGKVPIAMLNSVQKKELGIADPELPPAPDFNKVVIPTEE